MVLTGFSQLHPRCSILTSTYDFEKRRSFLVDGSIQLEQAIVARLSLRPPAAGTAQSCPHRQSPPLHTIAVSLSEPIKGFLRNESSQPAARPLRLSRSQPGTGGAADHGHGHGDSHWQVEACHQVRSRCQLAACAARYRNSSFWPLDGAAARARLGAAAGPPALASGGGRPVFKP